LCLIQKTPKRYILNPFSYTLFQLNPIIAFSQTEKLTMNLNLLSGKTILVVEDNSINQMLVKHVLSKSGVKAIHIASNGVIALDFLQNNVYDVILMDVHMPELDGYQTTEIIRNELKLTVPIVAMTALAIKGEDNKCISIGMNGYVSKPFTIESLYKELERVLEVSEEGTAQVHQLSDGEVTVDLSYLDELAASDTAYIKTMISLFLENMPATLDKMELYNNKSDWENLYRTAHYAKSSLSVIKIKQLFELSQQIENTVRLNKDYSTNASMIGNMKEVYAKAEKLLYKVLQLLITAKQVA
jgi:CheY-like chemotaxis protein